MSVRGEPGLTMHRTCNTKGQASLLQPEGHAEILEEEDKDEEVVDRQRVLNYVGSGEGGSVGDTSRSSDPTAEEYSGGDGGKHGQQGLLVGPENRAALPQRELQLLHVQGPRVVQVHPEENLPADPGLRVRAPTSVATAALGPVFSPPGHAPGTSPFLSTSPWRLARRP